MGADGGNGSREGVWWNRKRGFLIKILRNRAALVPGDHWAHRLASLSLPQPSPANQETRQRGSGGCFYGDDLTEGMVRTKPGTIHTYIYIIYRDAVLRRAGQGQPLARQTGSAPQSRPPGSTPSICRGGGGEVSGLGR